MSLEQFALQLPRNAFGPRDAARAGDVWRLFQDAAVIGSARRGWPPPRYREEGCAFVVRTMTVVHHRETRFGEPLEARTWVSSFRRETFSQRQIRVTSDGEAVCSASQKWVHVALPRLAPCRAQPELVASFEVVGPDEDVVLPPVVVHREGPAHELAFEVWHTTMDPLAHANHPAYVDWADEAICRAMAGSGADPQALVSIAGTLTWRSGVIAPERVSVRVALTGLTAAGDAVVGVEILGGDGRACADGALVRSSAEGAERLVSALVAAPREG